MTETTLAPRVHDAASGSARRRVSNAVVRHLLSGEPGLCEARWGALTLALTAALSAIVATVAGAVTPGRTLLDIVLPAGLTAIALDVATRVPSMRPWFGSLRVRRVVGPLVLVAASFTTGLPDVATLAPGPTAPLVLAALLYASLTPGFLPAIVLAASMTITLPLLHVAVAHRTIDPDGIAVLLRGLTAVVGATLAGLAWRHVRRNQERARRSVAELERITGIVRRFDGSRPVAEVLEDVAADLVIATSAGGIVVHAADGGRWAPVAGAGADGGVASPSPLVERAAAAGMTTSADEGAPRRWRAGRGGRLAVPVVHEGATLAVIEVRGLLPGTGPDVRARTELVASAIAGALRAAQLDAQRGVRLATVERLVRSGRTLSANLDRGRVVAEACALAADLLDADIAGFVRPDGNGGWVLEDGVGFDDGALGRPVEARFLGDAPGPTGAPAIPGGPDLAWIRALEMIPEAGRLPHGLAVPLVLDDEVVGLLGVARRRPGRAFSDAEAATADLLAIQVETALRNAVQHGRAVDLAIRDGLTGLLNRRYFDEALRRAAAAAHRSGAPLSLLVMDLDRFSVVNNEHGHAVGDEVLRRVAAVLRRHTRDSDVVARYGGEEFVLIAVDADADAARIVAERIHTAVADLSREPIDGLLLRTSISIGVATLGDDEAHDEASLFRRADDRLRAAKLAGRNRVIGA